MNFTRVFLVFAALCAMPSAAMADPISALITAISGFAASSALAGFLVDMAISFALSALSVALSGKSDTRRPGIKTEATTSGGDNPQSFVIGRYATAGNMVAPPYSHPNSGDLPNKFLTYVIDLADMAGLAFSRLMVNGQYVTDLQAHSGDHDFEGMFKDDKPHLFMTFHDGNQAVADAYMLANYSDYPERPWSADMVGTGVSYMVLTFKFERELFSSLPTVRAEVDGIPLYDPRLDDTAGGTGSQRWGDPSTWQFSANPAVMIYNILRGISLPDGRVWGGSVSSEDLPTDTWFAAMNECDFVVTNKDGNTRLQYQAGFEISLDMRPADVIDELAKACSAQLVELGGVYKIRVGAPALPSMFITDDDIIADEPEEFTPYPGMEGVYNAIHASYPDPSALWEAKEAPAIYNAEWEADDDGRQLVANVDLPAVANPQQVQQLMAAWIKDARRFAQHTLSLPPEAAILEPLDTVGWTSAENGYSAEVFEISGQTDDLQLCNQAMRLRSRAVGDFAWVPVNDEVDVSYPSILVPANHARTVLGWGVSASAILDTAGQPRLPGLRLTWDGTATDDATALHYQIRPAGQTALVAEGDTSELTAGALVVSSGLLPDTDYEARAIWVSARDGDWSAWVGAKTDDVRLDLDDLDPSVNGAIDAAAVSAAADKIAAEQAAAGAVSEKLAAEAAALSAATQADVVATTAARVQLLTLDSTFALGLDGITEAETAAPDAAADYSDPDLTVIASDDPEVGGKTLVATGEAKVVTKHVIPIDVDRKYRLRARVKRVLAASGDPILYLGFRNLKSDYSFSTEPGNSNTWCAASALNLAAFPVGPDYVEFVSPVITGTTLQGRDHNEAFRDDTVYARPKALLNYQSGSNPNHVMHLSGIWFEDVTESEAAKDHAAQAQVSETNAASSESNAAGDAAAAALSASSAQASLDSVKALKGNFQFADDLANWEGYASGTVILSGDSLSGGKKARCTGSQFLYYSEKIPVAIDRVYRVRARLKAFGSGGTSKVYVGVRTFDASGNLETTSPGTHRYCTLAGDYIPNDNTWREYEGIITSGGNSTNNQFRPTTSFASPLLLANLSQDATRELDVDYVIFEDITEAKAEAEIVQAALAETDGKLAASVTMRAAAGSGGAELELVAADDPVNGPVSAARIKADMLTVGIGGNLLEDSLFAVGADRFGIYSSSATLQAECSYYPTASTWVKSPVPTFQFQQNGSFDDGSFCTLYFRNIGETSNVAGGTPVSEGEWLEAHVRASTHRCRGRVVIIFRDDNNSWVGSAYADMDYLNPGNGNDPAGWKQYWLKAQVPAGATRAQFTVSKRGTETGSDSVIFLYQPYLGRTHEYATGPTPYSPGGQIRMHGGQLVAQTVEAQHIAAKAVQSDHMDVQNLAAVTSKLGNVTVDEKLTLGEDAGFLSGRPDRVSYEDDGFFVGATKKSDGQRGFEISHTHKDIYDRLAGIVHSEETGFQVFNPRFLVGAKDGAAVNNSLKYTSNGTYNIGSGRKELTLFVVGGGGAGGYGLSGGSGSGSAASGGTTSVEVYAGVPGSGGVKIGSTIQAAGGAGGLNAPSSGSGYTGTPGGNSSFGQGGAGGAPNTIGGDVASTAYGAGGGGAGGDAPSTFDSSGRCGFGGSAGVDKTVTIDLSAHEGSNIHLVVTIGGKGSGSGGTYRGGHGQKGVVAVADALSGYKEIDGNALYENLITSLAKAGEQTLVIGDGADELGPFTDNRLYIIGNVVSSSSNNDYRVRQIDSTQRRWIINMPGQFSRDELRTNTSNNTLDSNFDDPTGLCWVFLPAGGIQSWDGSSRTMTWENYSEIKDISEDMAREIIAKLQ